MSLLHSHMQVLITRSLEAQPNEIINFSTNSLMAADMRELAMNNGRSISK